MLDESSKASPAPAPSRRAVSARVSRTVYSRRNSTQSNAHAMTTITVR